MRRRTVLQAAAALGVAGLGMTVPAAAVVPEVRTRHLLTLQGGTFDGARLAGAVLDGGNDWPTVRHDGSAADDARLTLQTGDGALIGLRYRGIRHGDYWRILPLFETAVPQYDFLNRLVAVGIGQHRAGGVVFDVFEVL